MNNNFIGCNVYYRKEYFEKYGLFDEKYRLMEDYPNVVKTIKNNLNIGFIDKVCLEYRLGGVSNGKPNKYYVKDLNNFYDELLCTYRKGFVHRCLKYRKRIFNKSKFKRLWWTLLYIDVAIYRFISRW